MPLIQYDFYLSAGADWQKIVRLRDTTSQRLIPLEAAVMEIRNTNYVLVLRLDYATSRCVVLQDGASIQLHIPPADSLAYLSQGNYPGAVQAVGVWGIGRSYIYDLFVLYTTGVQDRIMRGYFYVDPNISRQAPLTAQPALAIGQRGNY
jgi:hypothetical protein